MFAVHITTTQENFVFNTWSAYLGVKHFGLILILSDSMPLVETPSIVEAPHGDPLSYVAWEASNLLC